jgi:curved DNA-binding protein CbpA
MAKDYYSLLSLQRSASPTEIRDRFRQLARERHPDRFQGAERAQAEIAFQEITEAFNVLSNPERRRQHDLELARPTAEPGGGDAQRLVKFHLEAGVGFYRDGNYTQAAEAFEKVTELDPKSHQGWHHLAQALAVQRRFLPRAGAAIARACELNPVSPPYLKLAGRIHAELGAVDKAERYYNEAIALGGEDAAVTKALEELRARSKKGRSGLFGGRAS